MRRLASALGALKVGRRPPPTTSSELHLREVCLEQTVLRIKPVDRDALLEAHGLWLARPQGCQVDPRKISPTSPRLATYAMDAPEATFFAQPVAQKRTQLLGKPVCDGDGPKVSEL